MPKYHARSPHSSFFKKVKGAERTNSSLTPDFHSRVWEDCAKAYSNWQLPSCIILENNIFSESFLKIRVLCSIERRDLVPKQGRVKFEMMTTVDGCHACFFF